MNEKFKSSVKNIHMTSVDDIFGVNEDKNKDGVQEIPLSELHPFKNHPFQVNDDAEMQKLVDSIRENGVLVPAIARPRKEGGYEIIAGHRRTHASELTGKNTIPVIIKNYDDDQATIIMVDSNIQRENLLPSERAFAYKMKLDAMKRQGKRTDLTCAQFGHKLEGMKSRDILAKQVGESKNQISRYIRLTELLSELLKFVDEKKLGFNPAVDLSYLKKEEQSYLLEIIEQNESFPSVKQARRMKELSKVGQLDRNAINAILMDDKDEPSKVTLPGKKLKKYFPSDYTPAQMENVILRLLQSWKASEGQ